MLSEKDLLRQQVKLILAKLSSLDIQTASAAIAAQLQSLPQFTQATHILAYWPIQQEVDLRPWIEQWSACGKQLYLPVIEGQHLRIGRFEGCHQLAHSGTFGIGEPEPLPHMPPIDLAIVPGLAFDPYGHRLGRGKGYYDRLLSQLPHCYKVGVCHPTQLVPHVPIHTHDIAMDHVACGETE